MFKKLIVTFAILALAVASAGTVPGAGANFRITLTQPSVVNGTLLKAGDYRLTILDAKVKIANAKQTVEAPAKLENVEEKFDSTAVCYFKSDGGQQALSEIRLGGTKTKVVFNR